MKRFQLIAAFCLTAILTGGLVRPASVLGQSPVRTATRVAVTPAATLADLRSRIDEIIHQPALDPGFFAVKIVSLDTGAVIFEQNANKFVRPASNMKLYTVAAGLDRLTPDFHFITSVYAREKVEDGK